MKRQFVKYFSSQASNGTYKITITQIQWKLYCNHIEQIRWNIIFITSTLIMESLDHHNKWTNIEKEKAIYGISVQPIFFL